MTRRAPATLRIELLDGFRVTVDERAVPADAWRRSKAAVVVKLQFAAWASNMPGAGRLQLVRDLGEPERFVSFGAWESIEQVRGWKSSPEFRERMARVLQHVDEFRPPS